MANFIYRGKEVQVSTQQARLLAGMKVSAKMFQERLDEGWSFDEALKYNHAYVMYRGKVCKVIETKEINYYVPVKELEKTKIPPQTIVKFLNDGDLLSDILPLGAEFYIVYNKKDALRNLVYEDYQSQQRRDKMIIERKRAKKPHLYNGTPQKHKRGKYCQYLMDTSIFPKAVH